MTALRQTTGDQCPPSQGTSRMTTRSFAPSAHASMRSAARLGQDTHAHTGCFRSNHSTFCGPYACIGSVIGFTDVATRASFSSLTFVEPIDRSPSPARGQAM
ncbi:hypothetical protein ASF96_02980 [Microbacterium sp. Leaf179]|nr:hypothetical protein ASF96_02980 [Microbacterium sp. Leaf179]